MASSSARENCHWCQEYYKENIGQWFKLDLWITYDPKSKCNPERKTVLGWGGI